MKALRTLSPFGLILGLACDCTSAPAPPPQPSPPVAPVVVNEITAPEGTTAEHHEVADSQHLTKFQKQRLIGHFSTENGESGLIFDRTVHPAKARLDGDGQVKTLASRPSATGVVEYVSDDRRIWLRVEEETGRVLLFQGPSQHNGVPVVRDADAEPLP